MIIKIKHDMAEHNDLGKWGEAEAARYLLGKGYSILERDWRQGHRDLDIVALTEERDTVVIVEVKTRQNDDLEKPEQAVDTKKMRNIAAATDIYVKQRNIVHQLRFDIISIVGTGGKVQKIEHIEDAFNPMLIL